MSQNIQRSPNLQKRGGIDHLHIQIYADLQVLFLPIDQLLQNKTLIQPLNFPRLTFSMAVEIFLLFSCWQTYTTDAADCRKINCHLCLKSTGNLPLLSSLGN